MVKCLLDWGADANAVSEDGSTVLMFAARSGNIQVVKLLLDKGASVRQQQPYYSSTPLIEAADAGHLEVVRLLLEKGANPDDFMFEKDSPTALTLATKNRHREIVQMLRAYGAK